MRPVAVIGGVRRCYATCLLPLAVVVVTPAVVPPNTVIMPPVADVLGTCWGTEELGWNEGSRKKLRDVR